MGGYRHQHETVVVATAKTASDAELIKMTLAVHGIAAVVSPTAPGHPSVDFVQGISVSVRPADEQAARDLLRTLDMGDGGAPEEG